MPIDVLLVDDHAAVREGFKLMIETAGGFRVIGQAGDHKEALHLLETIQPDLIVMDVSLQGLDGIDTTADILRLLPSARVVMLSMHDDQAHVVAALRAGARGYILKSANPEDLIEGLRLISQGVTYFSPSISAELLSRIQQGTLDGPANTSNLTRRELQVLRLVGEGRTNKEVAAVLTLETGTVRAYRKNLMRKLDARNGAALAMAAVSMGLVRVNRSQNGTAAAAVSGKE